MTIRHILGIAFMAAYSYSMHVWAQDQWMLLSRESGCGSLQLLVKIKCLPHAPSSPEELAKMMRARPSGERGITRWFPATNGGQGGDGQIRRQSGADIFAIRIARVLGVARRY